MIYGLIYFQKLYFIKGNKATLFFLSLLHEADKMLDKPLLNQEKILDAVNNF
jgi:hypothetical protein